MWWSIEVLNGEAFPATRWQDAHGPFLVEAALTAPSPGFAVVWGVSANTRSYWSPTSCEPLGYHPLQNSEDFAAEILAQPNPLDDLGRKFQGGSFASIDFTKPEHRHPAGKAGDGEETP